MLSLIINLIVAGAAAGLGILGVRELGHKAKPIPVRVRKERRR